MLLTKAAAAQNEVVLSYDRIPGLYFLAVVFEALHKRAIKWINCEEDYSFSDKLYTIRCKQADVLP